MEHDHGVLIADDVAEADPPTMGDFPCTKCGCQEFQSGPVTSVVRVCGHMSQDHNLS